MTLYRLNDAWRRHRTDAAQLLARDGVQRPGDTPEKIQHETVELEMRIAETRSESLLHDVTTNVPGPGGNQNNGPDTVPGAKTPLGNGGKKGSRTTAGGP